MKKILFLTLVFINIFSSFAYKDSPKIEYHISPVLNQETPVVKVRMKFKANTGEITRLRFQNNAWGEENLYNCLKSLQLLDLKGTVTKNIDSSWIEIRHPKGVKNINFEYILKQDLKDAPSSSNRYRPIITKDFFHIFSHNLFMIPDHYISTSEDILDIDLIWKNIPDEFVIHNSFGSKQLKQEIKEITERKFQSGIFVGGDFRTYKTIIEDNELVYATRGEWVSFKEDRVLDLLSKTIKSQRDFWDDHTQEYFTVTMIPVHQERGSGFGGTGLTNSFATVVSNNKETSMDQMAYLFNHELMHNWTGTQIKNENEEEQYWFSEGFTEYYTFKNILRNRILDLSEADFINEMNTIIRNLYTSPVAEVPNREINYKNYWSDRHYNKLPYYRGALFAFLIDQKIQKSSNKKYSLDQVMKDIFKAAKENNQKVNAEFFIKTVNQYLSEDITPFFETHILKGNLPDLNRIFNVQGLTYQPSSKVFELGFVLDNKTYKITSVLQGSEAFKSGIRVGDKLGGRMSIYYGDITKKVELQLLKEGKLIDISFYPIKEADIPQLASNEQNKELLKIN